ncbi:MAG: T9SS type A sorting domain-containing protein [Flavobacteriales bacterium]|nr:T9SS type A sorting domain-containing protein [Flavobacteriales bacterium]
MKNNLKMNFKTFKKICAVTIFTLAANVGVGQHSKMHIQADSEFFQEQAGTRSALLQTPLFKEIVQNNNRTKWANNLRRISSRTHGLPEVQAIKQQKNQLKFNQGAREAVISEPSTQAVTPEIATSFEGNWSIQGTPPDNTVAISNGGYIVTANNDGIEYYTENGNLLLSDFWSDFFNDGSLTSVLYDPKVIYDTQEDRFVLIVLHGSSSTTSQVLLSVSKTNNPQDGWWTYKLTGNPASDGSWFDYPNLGISNDDIFVSGNLFSNAGSFNQAVVYQIEKSQVLTGNTVNWQYFSNLSAIPFSAFTLVPASYGHQGNYGPGIYLVSSSAPGSSSIRLWEITDNVQSGNAQITSTAVTVPAYQVSADAGQLGSNDALDNGDCRIQNAFYLDTIVHFVFHSDIGNGWNGINYNRLDVSTNTIDNSTFGLSGSFDYSYPAVASFTNTNGDKAVMVAFLRSSSSSYPEARVVNCDHVMQWSNSTQVKAGETYVDFLNGDERWGDYTGIARKHNSPGGHVWMAGCYGADVTITQGTIPNVYKTYIAEIFSSATPPTSVEEDVQEVVKVYPNPVVDLFQLEFEAIDGNELAIQIFDMNGKLVKDLYKDTPRNGLNRLYFNKGALSEGTYFVRISSNQEILKNEKIIIVD